MQYGLESSTFCKQTADNLKISIIKNENETATEENLMQKDFQNGTWLILYYGIHTKINPNPVIWGKWQNKSRTCYNAKKKRERLVDFFSWEKSLYEKWRN